jgi:hypothetical protein
VRDRSGVLSPELLGALALVVDHLGAAYLLPPIRRWVADGRLNGEPPDLAALLNSD